MARKSTSKTSSRIGKKAATPSKARRLWILLGVVVAIGGIIGGLFLFRHLRREAWLDENRTEGLRLLAEGDPEAALPFLGRVVNRQPPDAEVLLAFAKAREAVPLEEGQHLMPAIQARLRLAELRPGDAELELDLMRLFARAGLAAEADLQAERILSRDPQNAEALRIRVQIAAMRGRNDEVQQLSAKLLARPDASFDELRTRAAAAFQEQRDPEELLRQMRRWSLPASLEPAREALVADILFRTGKVEEAQRGLDAAIAARPRDAGTVLMLVDMLDRLGQRERADALLAEAITLSPDREVVAEAAIARQWRANRMLAAREEIEKAEAAFGREDPRWARWRLRLAAIDPSDPLAVAAAKILQDRTEGDLAEVRAGRAWAAAIAAQGDDRLSDEEKASRLDEGVRSVPGDSTLLMLRGRQALLQGDAVAAIPDLRAAFDREQRSWVVPGLMLAAAYEQAGSPAEAVRTASDLLGRHADQLSVVLTFASVWANLESQGRSIDSLQIDTKPTIPLGEFLAETLERSSGEPRVGLLLAELGVRTGDPAMIEKGVAAAMAPVRLPPPLLVRFATIAVENRLPDAGTLVDRVAAQAPELPAGLRLRAELVAQSGRVDDAFAALREGLAPPAFPNLEDSVRASILAQFAQRYGLANAAELVAERDRLLADSEGVEAARTLLALPTTWGDEARARVAVDRLTAAVGGNHPEAVRAEARWVAEFRPTEPIRRDASIAALLRILDSGVEDREAAALLVRLEANSPTPDLVRIERGLRRLIELAPDNLAPYPDLARTLLRSGRVDLAAGVAKEYLDRAGTDLDRRREAIDLLRAAGDGANALAAAEANATASGEDRDWLAYAALLSENGRGREAGTILLARADRPDATLPAVMEAVAWLAGERRCDEGWQRLSARAASDPSLDLPVATLRFWMICDRPEAADAAAEALREASRTDPPAVIAIADWLESRNRLDEAVSLVGGQIEQQPDAGLLLAWAADRFAHPGWDLVGGGSLRARVAEAAPLLNELASLARESTSANGGLEPSAAQLERIMALIEAHPRDERVWGLAIRMHLAAGDASRAADLARRATTSLPRNPQLQLLRARSELAAASPAEAIATVSSLRSNESIDRFEIDAIEAEAAMALQDPERVLRVLAPYRTGGGSRFERIRGLLAAAELAAGRPDAAAELLSGDPRQLAMVAMTTLSNLSAATSQSLLRRLEPLIAEQPEIALPLAAQLLIQFNIREEALSLALADSLLERPGQADSPQRRLLRGDLAAAREERAAAIEIYRGVIDAYSADARRSLAAWPSRTPEEQAASIADRSILASALNNMAYQMSKLPSPGPEALAAVDEALVLLPGVPAIRDTRAKVLVALREIEAARAEAEALVAAAPEDAEFRLTLAQILRAAGAMPAARREITVAYGLLEKFPGQFPRVRRELDRLERSLGTEGGVPGGDLMPSRR